MGAAGGVMLGVCLAVLCLIIASIPIIKLIGWWADGGIEPLAALVGICLYLVLVVSVITVPSGVKFLFLALLVASAVLMPLFSQVAETRQNRAIDDEHLDSYVAALERNPMDPVARMALAEALEKRGDREQAREHMEWTLRQFPALGARIKPVLESWDRDERYEHGERPVICHMCYAENLPGATGCENCGAQFGTRAGIRQRVMEEGGPKTIARAWIVTSTAVIAMAFAMLYLPMVVSGPLILATAIVGAVIFIKWVGGTLGTVGE